ncbi:MAG: hypothetical protein PVJ28_09495 [Acidimicrobiia bacterium]
MTALDTANTLLAADSAGPDPAWRRFYTIGGICAALYVAFALVVPGVMVAAVSDFWDILVDPAALLVFITDNKLYWHIVQGGVLEASILLIITFAAVYLTLKHVDRVLAAIGAIISITTQLLFMAYYPVLLGLVYLSDQYATAGAARQASLEASAEALIAQNSAFNPIYEALMGVGILFLSLAMLKGVFSRFVAYLGIATSVAAFVGLSLYPIVGLGYFFWWAFFVVWLLAVGWKLYKLGRTRQPVGTTPPRAASQPAQTA